MTGLATWLESHRDRHLAELGEFLAIPSVSALPERRDDVRRCAEWIAGALRDAGLEHVRLLSTPGNPIVYGDWLGAPSAPTVLCYGHYDVQPADPLEQWESPPFQPTVRNGSLYARGASDDKGQLYAHVKAIEAHLSCTGHLPVNLKFIIEGEEEVGGESLVALLRRRGDLLAADVVIDSDSAMFDRGVPSLSYALRGLVYLELELRGSTIDLHSGCFGGAVANPAQVLAGILARLQDSDGRITIPGFYNDVRALTGGERASIAGLPFDDDAYRRSLGVKQLFGEPGFTTLERVWARPTLDINGLKAGFTGEGAKTIIPATASAKISMRLVPDQKAASIAALVEAHLARLVPPTMDVMVRRLHSGDPWLAGTDNPFLQAAARALAQGFGAEPVLVREGGSNSITVEFERALGVPTVMFGIGLPTDNPHAPNEHLELEQFHRGIIAAAHLYEEIARIRTPGTRDSWRC